MCKFQENTCPGKEHLDFSVFRRNCPSFKMALGGLEPGSLN